jgi:hypothetical protein
MQLLQAGSAWHSDASLSMAPSTRLVGCHGKVGWVYAGLQVPEAQLAASCLSWIAGRRSIPSRDYRQRLKEIAAMQKRRDKFLNDKLDELQDGMRNGLEELGRMMRHMRKDLQEEMRGGQSTINNHVDALHLHMTRSVLRRVKQRRSYSAPVGSCLLHTCHDNHVPLGWCSNMSLVPCAAQLTLKSLPSIKMYLAAALGEGEPCLEEVGSSMPQGPETHEPCLHALPTVISSSRTLPWLRSVRYPGHA